MRLPDAKKIGKSYVEQSLKINPPHRAFVRLAIMLQKVESKEQLESNCRRLKLSNQQSSVISAILYTLERHSKLSSNAEIMAAIDKLESFAPGLLFSVIFPAWRLIFPEKEELIKKFEILEETKSHLRKGKSPSLAKILC